MTLRQHILKCVQFFEYALCKINLYAQFFCTIVKHQNIKALLHKNTKLLSVSIGEMLYAYHAKFLQQASPILETSMLYCIRNVQDLSCIASLQKFIYQIATKIFDQY